MAGPPPRWMTDADWKSLPHTPDTPALVLFHGLEGGSNSRYAQSIAHHFRARLDRGHRPFSRLLRHAQPPGARLLFRRLGRGRFPAGDRAQRIPHARWHAVGVSLGGNALLKYLGEHHEDTSWLTACAGVSVPLDLVACGKTRPPASSTGRSTPGISSRRSRTRCLKGASLPGRHRRDAHRARARSARLRRRLYRAHAWVPQCAGHWTRASSKPWLPRITAPTLVLNALNDPFIPASALPKPEECSASVLLHQPADGGHAGFRPAPFRRT